MDAVLSLSSPLSGLPRSAAARAFSGLSWLNCSGDSLRGVLVVLPGVASRSRRLMSEARSFVAASNNDRNATRRTGLVPYQQK